MPPKRFHSQKTHSWSTPRGKALNCRSNQFLETEVGICEFISKLDGFSGIIKARYSDFQVNEINLDGQLAELTDTCVPKEFHTPKKITEIPKDTPLSLISQSKWEELLDLMNKTEIEEVLLDVESFSKEDRKSVHECCQLYFYHKISSSTITENDRKVMKFTKCSNQANNRTKWPTDLGEYVHFLVYKESMDTLEATLKLSDIMGMAPSNFTYAGVKDKRAKTTQWYCVKKINPNKLLGKTRHIRNIKIGNITFKSEPLKLGQLMGNKFRIALRNVVADDKLIEEALNSLKQNGFINYYGLQRFGNNKEVPTFSIGINLLLGKWKEACSIILQVTSTDNPDIDITKAKKVFNETGDVAVALKQFDRNRNKCIEYKLLEGLNNNHANDYVNALEKIPRNIRLLYIHAFQSLVWNQVTSKRISFGLKPIEGDLVILNEQFENENGEEEEPFKQEVKVLTAEDLNSYTIFDVVLPLPGYGITYPSNVEAFYQEILTKHGLTLEMTKQNVQTYNLKGNYRKILNKVENLSWKILHYNDPNENLIQSDWEKFCGINEPKDIENGKYKALILEFTLQASSYATMALREILKTDTSSSSHAKLNNYYEGKNEDVKNSDNEGIIEPLNHQHSLLLDKNKYEQFKNLVFKSKDNKRKLQEDSAEDGKVVKKVDL